MNRPRSAASIYKNGRLKTKAEMAPALKDVWFDDRTGSIRVEFNNGRKFEVTPARGTARVELAEAFRRLAQAIERDRFLRAAEP